MPPGNFAATFHVYLNQDERLLQAPPSRNEFDFVDEKPPHGPGKFQTYSDLSWKILRKEMARYGAK